MPSASRGRFGRPAPHTARASRPSLRALPDLHRLVHRRAATKGLVEGVEFAVGDIDLRDLHLRIGAEDVVDAGLVAVALGAKEFGDAFIKAQGDFHLWLVDLEILLNRRPGLGHDLRHVPVERRMFAKALGVALQSVNRPLLGFGQP